MSEAELLIDKVDHWDVCRQSMGHKRVIYNKYIFEIELESTIKYSNIFINYLFKSCFFHKITTSRPFERISAAAKNYLYQQNQRLLFHLSDP